MEVCSPHNYHKLGFSSMCEYVTNNSDICEGGGYIAWTAIKVCADSPTLQTLVVIAAILFFVYLFLILSITADDFFCTNIASIIDHHRISQNIAGITFMAFGNGAPDIFSSIASVMSVHSPQAGLAISELLGGGIFVTTVVVAAIILYEPFDVMRRPAIRDICFYLIALGMLVCVVLYDKQIHYWQPIMFLILYGVYATTVVSGNVVRQRMRRSQRKVVITNKVLVKVTGLLPKKSRHRSNKVAPVSPLSLPIDSAVVEEAKVDEVAVVGVEVKPQLPHNNDLILAPTTLDNAHRIESSQDFPRTLVISVGVGEAEELPAFAQGHLGKDLAAKQLLEAGKFFGKEELESEQEEMDAASSVNSASPIVAVEMLSPSPSSGSASPSSSSTLTLSKEIGRLLALVSPFDLKALREAGRWQRIYLLVKIPCMSFLNLTSPVAVTEWSKPLAILHALLVPITFCLCFQIHTAVIVPDGPPLWVFALLLSAIASLIIAVLTQRGTHPPKYYKPLAAYTGFLMSIAWIYFTATEVVDIVMMLGHLFDVSYQILGITAVAWSNSVGDFIADFSVAKQGFPRMGFSAAIGAPLFNLMVGFGVTFLIAKAQGKTVTVEMSAVNKTMFIALALSLTSTLVLLFIQKFRVRRVHAAYLIALYITFLVFAVLAATGRLS